MTGWTRQRICSYSIRRFLLIKHYICSRVWVSKTSFFFFLTWHCDRRIRPPRYQTWQWDRLFTFSSLIFLALNQKNVFRTFFLQEEEKNRKEKKRGGAWGSQSYRVKHKEKMDKRVYTKKDERRHKGLHCCSLHHRLHQLPLAQRGSHRVCLRAL